MEILLNTFWLFVAIGAFLFWRSGKYRSTLRSRRTTAIGILALACALILLFPVISLTDDLHAEMTVMEDSSGAVMKARALSQGDGRSGKFLFHTLVAPSFRSFSVQLVVISQVIPSEICLDRLIPIQLSKGRAPPVERA